MQVIDTRISDVKILKPQVYNDSRGYFFESFNELEFHKIVGRSVHFYQDNHSKSAKNVLRGLHYQVIQPQGKLVRVVAGSIFDVVVDLREDSPTFGKWIGEYLTADNKHQLWVPPGFAHGFLSLDDDTEVLYKTTELYAPQYDRCIHWNAPDIGIEWPGDQVFTLSVKDELGVTLAEAETFRWHSGGEYL